MQIIKRFIKNDSAMTLVEILVSLVILGLLLMAIFPLLTQSLQVTNLANQITAQLFADQEDIEIVAATNGGVLFADGTFLTDKEFTVLFGASAPFNSKTVVGMTIKKNKLVRFIASIARIKATYVYEGYNASEAEIPITGTNTNFIDGSTVWLITDNTGNDVTSSCICTIISQTEAQVVLPVDSSRFINKLSPYTITMTTGNEQASTLLPVYLPRAIAVDANRDLRISSNAIDWIGKETSSIIDHSVNKIVFMATSEQDAKFVAAGDNGSIYIWANGQDIQKVVHNLTSQNLNNIIYSGEKNLLLICGDGGIILTSPNGTTWTRQNTGTPENLQAISYLTNSNCFICVGARGGILTSSNGSTWTRQHIHPLLAATEINDHNAVKFSGDGDYLKTIQAPVTADIPRTVLMIAKPQKITASLLAWGSPLDTIEGGRFSFGIDSAGKLRVEQSGAYYSADLSPVFSQPSLLICRSTANDFSSYQLSLNGGDPHTSNVSAAINTSDYFPLQLGSDPLTRYIDPVNFEGSIAEVLIFDTAVNAARTELDPVDPDIKYASDLDLLRKYLSDKYGLGFTSLDGKSMDDLIDPNSGDPLSIIIIDSFPTGVSQDDLVLWLDASNPDSLDLENDDQVLLWKDLSAQANHASGAALLSVACSSNRVVTGGFHRNLIDSANTSIWNQTHQLNTKRITEYSMDNMVCTESNPEDTTEIKFVALLNDGLSSFTSISTASNRQNGLIAYSSDGIDWTLNDLSSTNNFLLNDMFYCVSSRTILVVGNHGSMFTSSDNGVSWNTVDLGTYHTDLLAGCIR